MDAEKRPSDPLGDAARERFGIAALFPYQRLVISNVLEAASRRDGEESPYARQVVILPTGSGKSLCFQIPALFLAGPTLVVFPLLSLMADQERRLRAAGLPVVVIRGGQDAAERRAALQSVRSGETRLILTNPEALCIPVLEPEWDGLGVSHLVIDEAHCVAEWGESFRPAYLALGDFIRRHHPPVVTAFTATASPRVLERVERILFDGAPAHLVMENPDRPNVSYAVLPVLSATRTLTELARRVERPLLVFCRSRDGAKITARHLRERLGGEVYFYHAGLSPEEKKAREAWFFSSRDGILCATCAYGLGIDKPDIRTVIHRDVPPSVEAYLQESGRAGRDRAPALAVMLYSPTDGARAAALPDSGEKTRMEALLAVARDPAHCRRRGFLALLGSEPGSCSGCDVCGGHAVSEAPLRGELSRFLIRNGRRYGRQELRAILGGTSGPVLSDGGGNLERDRSLLSGWEADEIEEAIRSLILSGDVTVRGTGKGSHLGPPHSSAPWWRRWRRLTTTLK